MVKRKRTLEEKQWAREHAYSSVECKLNTLCRDPYLLAEIRWTCGVLKQIQVEAWHVANLHVLRCLESGQGLPRLTQDFFIHCCQAARARFEKPGHPPVVDAALRATIDLYRDERLQVDDYVPPPMIEYEGRMISDLAAQMEVNCKNMVVVNFERRLALYVRLIVEARLAVELKDAELVAKQWDNRSSSQLTRAERTEKKNAKKAVNAIKKEMEQDIKRLVRACYRPISDTDDTSFRADEIELRAWLGMPPWHDNLENNLEHFVSKLYDILKGIEATKVMNPAQYGLRALSLLPVSHSFVPAHITINGSTLHGLCNRVFQSTEGYNPLGIRVGPSGRALLQSDVPEHKQLYLRRAFSVSCFETMVSGVDMSKDDFDQLDPEAKAQVASRLFANRVTTNGYSASVLMQRPKSARDEQLEKLQKERIKGPKRRKQAAQRERDLEWESLPVGYVPDVYVGIDPGMRNMCTAARVSTEDNTEAVVQFRTAEYRHLSGINKSQYWHASLRKRELRYSDAISRIPSFKTASATEYLTRLKIYWKYVGYLIWFSATRPFLKQRFFVKRMKAKALAALAKRVVPVASPSVLVGYGDWINHGGTHGHPPTPVKAFRRALAVRATVVSIDEYNTSKLCSRCSTRLEMAVLKARVQLGEIPSHKTHLPFRSKDDELLSWSKTRDVLRCPSSVCRTSLWDRDINAARNMLMLLVAELHGLPRPEAFSRAQASAA